MSMHKSTNTNNGSYYNLNPEVKSLSTTFNQDQQNMLREMSEEDIRFCKDVLEKDCSYPNDSNNDSLFELFANLYPDEDSMNAGPLFGNLDSQDFFSNIFLKPNDQSNREPIEMEVRSVQDNSAGDHSEVFEQSASKNNSGLVSSTITTSKRKQSEESLFDSQNSSDSLSQSSYSNSISSSESEKKSKTHLKLKRRPKGSMKGKQYPTKNLLPPVKKIHWEQIVKVKGQKFIQAHPKIKQIFGHNSAVKKEFKKLYQHPAMKKMWVEFFNKKVLYRKIMETKIKGENMVMFMKYLGSFEYAFYTGKFEKLTVDRSEELRMLKLQRQKQCEKPSSADMV